MGDLAVGARSGHGEPERRPGDEGQPGEHPRDLGGRPGARDEARDEAGPRAGDGPDGRPPVDAGNPDEAPRTDAGRDGGQQPPDGGADPEPARREPSRQRSFWKELPLLIGIALLLALVIKTFLVQAFSIPSESMQNTLQRGDRVLVDKLTPWFGSKPERGEVVVFHDPGGWLGESPAANNGPIGTGIQKVLSFVGLMPSAEEKDLIKRVIATGGDTVECKGDNQPVVVNGKPLDEPYIFPGNTPCGDKPFGPVKVPEGRIWVMGDHRQDSLDSRWHMEGDKFQGTVSEDDVVGRAVAVAWPLNRLDVLSVPKTFDQPGLSAAGAAVPPALGLAGALPVVLWRRRRIVRKAAACEPVTRAGRRG
ncbi:signal peptidase I [Streptomyces griseocarneus]|uniref:signal peptidase I n=1 Tax=Streptomyces griseocarneus TaxID=51201 RepID=UPI00167E6F62|nr:signal peptidase I [Streptomyces griseocarneus]MBZ6477277.1 signal peptidase I [Streptomyces griseocarneus]GHG55407.1 signal peptidase I [Streptomyces griseocarneus]